MKAILGFLVFSTFTLQISPAANASTDCFDSANLSMYIQQTSRVIEQRLGEIMQEKNIQIVSVAKQNGLPVRQNKKGKLPAIEINMNVTAQTSQHNSLELRSAHYSTRIQGVRVWFAPFRRNIVDHEGALIKSACAAYVSFQLPWIVNSETEATVGSFGYGNAQFEVPEIR